MIDSVPYKYSALAEDIRIVVSVTVQGRETIVGSKLL